MAAYRNADGMTLTGAGEAENLKAEMVSAGFFEIAWRFANCRPNVYCRRRPAGRKSHGDDFRRVVEAQVRLRTHTLWDR